MRGLHLGAWVLAAGIAAAPMVFAESVELTLGEARVFARDAYRAGDFPLAYSLAQGVLQGNPQDPAALLVTAATAPHLGRPAEGVKAGRLAFRLAPTDGMKFEAARFTAISAVKQERLALAQFWLRRATAVAPTEGQAQRSLAELQAVRSLNPTQVSLSFSVAPSSNLNNGSSSEYDLSNGFIGRLDAGARALSGVRATVGVQVLRRVQDSEKHQTALGFRGFASLNRLSSEAKALIAEDVLMGGEGLTGSDLNYTMVEGFVRHGLRVEALRSPIYVTGGISHSWYGGEKYARGLRFDLDHRLGLSRVAALDLGMSARRHLPYGNDTVDALSVSAEYTRDLSNGDEISLGVDVQQSWSADVNDEATSANIRLGYDFAKPIGPVQVSAWLGAGFKTYDAFWTGAFVPGGRQDESVEFGIDMMVPQANIAGFAPVVSLNLQRTNSNVTRFEARELGVSLGFRSLF